MAYENLSCETAGATCIDRRLPRSLCSVTSTRGHHGEYGPVVWGMRIIRATPKEVFVMAQTNLWTYRTNLQGTKEALVGCGVEARDGSIGKIDEATNETGRAYVVVDTGPWIFGRKVVIPAGTIERIDVDDKNVFVAMTKDQIKDSPEYDPARFDEDYRTRLGTYYEPYM